MRPVLSVAYTTEDGTFQLAHVNPDEAKWLRDWLVRALQDPPPVNVLFAEVEVRVIFTGVSFLAAKDPEVFWTAPIETRAVLDHVNTYIKLHRPHEHI